MATAHHATIRIGCRTGSTGRPPSQRSPWQRVFVPDRRRARREPLSAKCGPGLLALLFQAEPPEDSRCWVILRGRLRATPLRVPSALHASMPHTPTSLSSAAMTTKSRIADMIGAWIVPARRGRPALQCCNVTPRRIAKAMTSTKDTQPGRTPANHSAKVARYSTSYGACGGMVRDHNAQAIERCPSTARRPCRST